MTMTAVAPIDMTHMGRLNMTRLANEEEDPSLLTGINYPGKHDVMLGRGGESTYHCGNIAFRQLVEDHKNKYYLAPRAHKSRVVAEVVHKWRQLTPQGRFLTRSNPNEGDKSSWHDVGDRRALKKASHSLRDAVRCFSIEKKQREKEQKGHTRDEVDDDFDDDDDPFVAHLVSASDGRKRGRVEQEPEYMPSFSDTKGLTIGRYQPASKADKYISTVAVSQKKSSSLLILPALEERPTKMRRVVCDEREEAEDDCRREGGDDDDCGRGDDERCSGGERDSCSRDEDCGRQVSLVSSMQIPQKMEYPAARRSKSLFRAPPQQQPMLANTCRQQQERLDGNASPCGSADWFTSGMSDLPVRAAPSYALPTADVLVREVNQAVHAALTVGSLSDDESVGWFSEGEDENPASFFNCAPSFHVSLHKPLAIRKNHSHARASSGREL